MVMRYHNIYIILLKADWFSQTVMNNKIFTYKNIYIQQVSVLKIFVSLLP
jgi:hypothetical protein